MLANGLTISGKSRYIRYISKGSQKETTMNAQIKQLKDQLNAAIINNDYRHLQTALKLARAAKYAVNCKLNAKKEILLHAANVILINIFTTYRKERAEEQQEWEAKQSRDWDKRYNEYKRNRNSHQYGWSESERRMYEEWQQRRRQQQPAAAEAPHQKFIAIFNQKLGQSYTKADLKKVYKELAKLHHPDLGGKKEDFQALQKAYEIMV